jgi:ABC-type enterochelin transport system substrate-binding protein
MDIGKLINLDDEGLASELPKKQLLNAALRILTDTIPEIGTVTRIDIKTFNGKQINVSFNSSKVGQSLLAMPSSCPSLAVNINLDELILSFKKLLQSIEELKREGL